MKISRHILTICIIALCSLNSYGVDTSLPHNDEVDDYGTAVAFRDGFAVCHGDGWIDWVSVNGEVVERVKVAEEAVADLIVCDSLLFISTVAGEIMRTDDLVKFDQMKLDNSSYARHMIAFRGYVILSAASDGVLVIDQGGQCWKIELRLKGNIISFSANEDECYGVTDEGEILSTTDGVEWGVVDFNELYAGFYTPCSFTGVSATPQRIALIGVDKVSGEPLLFGSTEGEVWNPMELDYKSSDGQMTTMQACPNEIVYDTVGDRFLIVCDDGQLMYVPACSHCYHAVKLSDKELTSMAINNNCLIVVGKGGFMKTLDGNW